MSGGRATVQYKVGRVNLTQSGDVSAVGHGAYEFCERVFVEVKHYRDLAIGRGFVCDTGALRGFWDVACREAERYGKTPLLIARQNLYPTLAITRSGGGIFRGEPLITLRRWDAEVYLFDEVTAVRPTFVRRAS